MRIYYWIMASYVWQQNGRIIIVSFILFIKIRIWVLSTFYFQSVQIWRPLLRGEETRCSHIALIPSSSTPLSTGCCNSVQNKWLNGFKEVTIFQIKQKIIISAHALCHLAMCLFSILPSPSQKPFKITITHSFCKNLHM